MQQLVSRVTTETGVPPEQVAVVINALADYVKEKYPLLAFTVDMVLENPAEVAAS